LLLVLIGGVLLAANFMPEIRPWEFFSRFWPALLILWGLAKLFDYFAAQRTGTQAPPSFTAGEFFLLLFLLLLGGSLSTLRWAINNEPGFYINDDDIHIPGLLNPYTFTEETNLNVTKRDAVINVANLRGDVNIIPEADSTSIRVVTKKTVLVMGGEADAKERAERSRIEIRDVGAGYEIRRVDNVTGRNLGRVAMNLEIHVPRTASIEAKLQRGNFSANGLAGSINVDSSRGDVEIRDAAQNVDVHMRGGDVRIAKVKGNVRLSGSGSEIDISDVAGEAAVVDAEFGGIRISNIAKGGRFVSRRTDMTFGPLPGRLELGSGDLEVVDLTGSVDITTNEKDIRLENVSGRVRIQNRRGDIAVRFKSAPKEEVDVSNESGKVELTLPAASAFEISASSQNGEVESEFEGPELKKTEEHESGRLEGKIGARGPQIRLKTTYGTVALRKSA
jgi:hypothetical protein